jgi:hypothetical protein
MAISLFKAINNYLPTKQRLIQRRLSIDPLCVIRNSIENIEYIYFECEYSANVWKMKFKCPASHSSILLLQDEVPMVIQKFPD